MYTGILYGTYRPNFVALFAHSTFTDVAKMLFTQATLDFLINNKTKNALHNEVVISNYIGGDPISHGLSN